ncbi:uncharacterized protein LOC108667088 [Hyalella azteca]|uniref:Uncharacterized protein LOC108667088 n=1 Tax=Hyalella azteca TaxID=294128 RepID=A0A8B7N6U4_HYAAZ|nr:uncharacterized protein LOC108667088 [Hyalella azteca]
MKLLFVSAIVALLTSSANAFFWPCPAITADNTTSPNVTVANAEIKSFFPANVYLKSGSAEDNTYSCLKISLLELNATAGTGNATYEYYLNGVEKTNQGTYALANKSPFGITFTGLPNKMFGADSGTKSLAYVSKGTNYGIFRSCQGGFLNFGYTNYAYLFTTSSFDSTDLDWRCMATGFKTVVPAIGGGTVYPGGICSSGGGHGGGRISY